MVVHVRLHMLFGASLSEFDQRDVFSIFFDVCFKERSPKQEVVAVGEGG